MSENIKITREVYQKNIYTNVIDTEFSQLIQPVTQIKDTVPTIGEFFKLYNDLFFEIPKTGDIDSHTELVERSSQYLGDDYINPLIAELRAEITALKQQSLNSSEIINDLTNQLSTLGDSFNDITSQTKTVASTSTVQ